MLGVAVLACRFATYVHERWRLCMLQAYNLQLQSRSSVECAVLQALLALCVATVPLHLILQQQHCLQTSQSTPRHIKLQLQTHQAAATLQLLKQLGCVRYIAAVAGLLLTASSRGLLAALPIAITGSFGSFSSIRNTEVSTECSVPDSSSTRSEVPAAEAATGTAASGPATHQPVRTHAPPMRLREHAENITNTW
jgi:hypothetical protein